MPTDKELEDLVNMIDERMSEGSGHLNIQVNDEKAIEVEDVEVESHMDCDCGDTSCKIPNLPEY